MNEFESLLSALSAPDEVDSEIVRICLQLAERYRAGRIKRANILRNERGDCYEYYIIIAAKPDTVSNGQPGSRLRAAVSERKKRRSQKNLIS